MIRRIVRGIGRDSFLRGKEWKRNGMDIGHSCIGPQGRGLPRRPAHLTASCKKPSRGVR